MDRAGRGARSAIHRRGPGGPAILGEAVGRARPRRSRSRPPVEYVVLVGKVATLVQTGWQALPELSDRLAHIEPFVGTPEEVDAVRQAYELMPRANFSKHVLEVCPDALAVSRLPRIVWSDLGSPHRVNGSPHPDAGPSGVGADAGPVGLIRPRV